MLQKKPSSKSGIFRFKSIEPAKKIYGRLDFLSPSRNPRLSRSTIKSQSRKVLLSRSSSIDRQTKRKFTLDLVPKRPGKQADAVSTYSRTIDRYDSQTTPLHRTLDITPHHHLHNSHNASPMHQDNPQSPSPSQSQYLSNLNYHSPDKCLCKQCTCGRHMCKFQSLTPRASLQMDSLYRREYSKKSPMPRLEFRPVGDSTGLKSPTVDLGSSYLRDYRDRFPGRPDRPIPDDNLGFKGPQASLSNYRKQFPGFHGDNQYIKPTDKHYLKGLPFTGTSIYRKQYLNSLPKISQNTPINRDSLKNLNVWMGDSSYRSNFKQPEKSDYQNYRARMLEKRKIIPDIGNRFDTIYRNSFAEQKSTVCRAKVLMETKMRGQYENSKGQFNQNCDYKAASPSFHAIATSKHYYV